MVYERMIEWLKFFRNSFPEIYYWTYTNGLEVSRHQMMALSDLGLNELRFNIAATGYDNKKVLGTIKEAVKIFEHVAVEIPSIPGDFGILSNILSQLSGIGVHYLNLHEYILVPSDPNRDKVPTAQFIMNKEMKMAYHQKSLENTERIKSLCEKNKINLLVNNCSLKKKEDQMKGRRITMGTLFKQDYERLSEDGFLETVYFPKDLQNSRGTILNSYSGIDRACLIHPDDYKPSGTPAYMLTILPAMSIESLPRIIQYKRIHEIPA